VQAAEARTGPAALSRLAGLLDRLPGRSGQLAEQALRVAEIRAAIASGQSPRAALQAGLGLRTSQPGGQRTVAAVTDGATVSGTVTAAWTGQPLAGVCVDAQNLRSGGMRTATSGQDGSYTITGLIAGTYDVRFLGCGPGLSVVTEYWDNQESDDTARSVPVSAGQVVTGIDAAMQQAGTVSGLVTDTNGHRPSGVCVQLTNANFSVDGEFFGRTVQGRYTVADLPPGHYFVDFGCQGYPDHLFVSPADHRNPADYLAVPAGITTRLNARLRIAGQISGLARSRAGALLPNVCVFAMNVRTLDFGAAITGKSGGYTLRHLEPGRYRVQFIDCGGFPQHYASQWYRRQASQARATRVPVHSYRTTHAINAQLSTGGAVAGTVTSAATHRPVRGVGVIASDAAAGNIGIAITGRHGRFVLGGLPTGSYQLSYLVLRGSLGSITAAHEARVIQPATTRTSVTLPLAGSVAGTVLAGNPAKPAADVCVQLGSGPLSGLLSLFDLSLTGRHGKYKLTNLRPGSYLAQFTDCSPVADQAPQWYRGTPYRANAAKITVRSGQVTSGIGGTLKPDGSLSGTVTGPGAQPLAGICATLYPQAGDTIPIVAITTADGNYSVPAAVPGRYKIEFSAGCGASGYATAWYPSPVTVRSGAATTGIDAAMAPG